VVVDNPYFLTDESFGDYPAGEITLTGEEAIRFCRSRNMDGDGGRVMRQHLVLGGMLAKLQSPAMLTRVPQLIDTLSGEVVNTNISTAIQARLIAMLPTLSGDNLAFTNIEDQLSPGYTSGGAWIYQGDWSTLPGYVQSWLAGP
jgi:anionic cell wall polymer biosynthesis LytR-Cps2A-Psr (LCP) family protein